MVRFPWTRLYVRVERGGYDLRLRWSSVIGPRRWWRALRDPLALLDELDQERAMLRALADGRSIDPASAQAVQAVALAEYVSKWLQPLHRGHTLTKADELTIDQACEIAHDVVILGDAHSHDVPPDPSPETDKPVPRRSA